MSQRVDVFGDVSGQYGRALLQSSIDLPVRLWRVSQTDPLMLRGFLPLEGIEHQIYNVSISVERRRIPEEAMAVLSKPVQRAVLGRQITMQPEIMLNNVTLYTAMGDQEPAVQFDTLRIIVGPTRSAGLLIFVCANVSPAKMA